MNLYPFNLVLAAAMACATIFLGFLPTRTLKQPLLTRETLQAAFGWGFLAATSPPGIFHYPLGVAGLSLLAWWQFRRDEPFMGKIWLSMASGLGISLGVMLLLAVTPYAYPLGQSQFEQGLLLASVYLGGAVIGLAYVSGALIAAGSGVEGGTVRRYVDLLVPLVAVRAVVLLLRIFPVATGGSEKMTWQAPHLALPAQTYDLHAVYPFEVLAALVLLLLVVPVMAVFAWREVRSGSLKKAQIGLMALALVAFAAELLARHLGL